MVERAALQYLKTWYASEGRKPLVIRGARQVGKTWLVRQFVQAIGKQRVELNFEKHPEFASLFTSNEPSAILKNIGSALNVDMDVDKSVLFLDEIQAAPSLLSKLRWFAEECPELPVLAAGSLLEFVLSDYTFSMPVGRINYCHLEPLSFEEFLLAHNKKLWDFVRAFKLSDKMPEAIHKQLMALVKTYLLVGGLPAAVSSWLTHGSLQKVNHLHHDLLATYGDDFAKYSRNVDVDRCREALAAIPRFLGEKFMYSRVNQQVQSRLIKKALDVVEKARICHSVSSCSANGLPLGAEVNDRFFKMIFLDVGLGSALLGLKLHELQSCEDINLINKGGVSEQMVGQLLRTIDPFYVEPKLYYWVRCQKGQSAELDYVIQHNHRVVPIEVKSGATGSLKSLHFFMGTKKSPLAVRINSDFPSHGTVNTKLSSGEPVQYRLLSLPFYLVGQLHRLLDEVGELNHG